MENNEFDFIGTDPGAVKYGNFINYYSFHSAQERLKSLQVEMFPKPIDNLPYYCLDIGCNTGELTIALHSYLEDLYPNTTIYMLAIDIDHTLIKRAKESFIHKNITFMPGNIMKESDKYHIHKYLSDFGVQQFNVTFCFSVSMWLHINNGDEGLVEFLNYMCDLSSCIVIEPQPWHCYRNAQRRLKKSGSTFSLYEKLRIRSNVESFIESNLTDRGYKNVYESPSSSWKRKIISFQAIKSI